MLRLRIISFLILLPVSTGMIVSCAGSIYPDVERGTEYYFREGFPEVRISALGFLDAENKGIIRIAADLVNESLIYREEDGITFAEIGIEIRVVGTEQTDHSETFTTSLKIDRNYEGYEASPGLVQFKKEMNAPPGRYEIHLSVVDLTSNKNTTRTTETFIPDPAADQVHLTSVQMLGKYRDRYWPVTTYDVSTANDSVRFLIQVTNNRPETPLTVVSELLRFDADTDPARPLVYNNYPSSTLPYRGIDYNREEVLQESRRVLQQPGSVLIEYRYPLPARGNYRFQVKAEGTGADGLFNARDFGVKSENYPTLKKPEELAAPLAYLMGRRDYERLISIDNSDSLRSAIDNFWLSNIGDADRARRVIALYYERVEEANKQFSNFKEGWKTDMGMIYILFGPPLFTKRYLGGWIWSYSYDIANPEYHFRFIRPRTRRDPSFPFDHYLLERESGSFNIQSRQIHLWLSGNILEVSLADAYQIGTGGDSHLSCGFFHFLCS